MKYIIDIPEDTTCLNALRYEDRKCVSARSYIIPNLIPYVRSESYIDGLKRGQNDAWNFARSLLNYTNKDWEDVMNLLLINSCSYQEAKNKYKEWQKEKNEIQIGDEVKNKGLEDKGIVTYIEATRCDVLWSDGSVNEDFLMSDLYKTGRHFDEIQNLLKTIEEEKDE